jgi:hypothetical protein
MRRGFSSLGREARFVLIRKLCRFFGADRLCRPRDLANSHIYATEFPEMQILSLGAPHCCNRCTSPTQRRNYRNGDHLMASPAQIAANRLNSRKSTGPRTPEGQAKSSMNALKHGNRSRKLALLREESLAFEERLRKWMAIGDAQNDVEEYLVYRNVAISFELDRTERARLERCRSLIENLDEEEAAEAEAIGKQLFFDPAGPTPLYGNPTVFSAEKKTSWNGQAVDPHDPAVLVRILERNAAGCCWLRDQWQALRALLESPGFWQSHDRLKAIRLLGRQPLEANQDRRVATIFVANHALHPTGKTGFGDLWSDMQDSQRSRYRKAVHERWPDLFSTRDSEEWRQILITLVDQNIQRLNAKLEVHEQNAEAHDEQTVARLSFDPSPEGEALRNYLLKCTNALVRGMANYRKYKAKTSGGWGVAGGVGGHGNQVDWSEGRGREAHERDGRDLMVGDSFGSGDSQDDRLERGDLIGRDGVEPHEDEVSGMGEIAENASNEANVDETMIIAEPQESIQVTANSGALPGLDNSVPEPAEGSRPERGTAPGSGSESSSPQHEAPDSSDLASSRSSPVTLSKREKRRLRLREERRLVEKMVAEKLKAGNFAPGEILMTAMTMQFPEDRDP